MNMVTIKFRGTFLRTLFFKDASEADFYARTFFTLTAGDGTWDTIEVTDSDGLPTFCGVVMNQ